MRRIHKEVEGDSGWTRWIRPRMDNYIIICCDCGLAHRLQFCVGQVTSGNVNGYYKMQALPSTKFRAMFRAQRAPRYTKRARKLRELPRKVKK